MTRFCPSCQAQVADTGGFCLLGHRLGFDPADDSFKDLRAEVEQVFEAARLEVEAVLDPSRTTPVVAQPTPAPPAVAPAPPAAVPVRAVSVGGVLEPPPSPSAVEHVPASNSGLGSPQPPVIAQEAHVAGGPNSVWSRLADQTPIDGDPIEAFAPPPRMDWGPERTTIWRRRSHARRPSTAII
jgi:hypothetical protein